MGNGSDTILDCDIVAVRDRLMLSRRYVVNMYTKVIFNVIHNICKFLIIPDFCNSVTTMVVDTKT